MKLPFLRFLSATLLASLLALAFGCGDSGTNVDGHDMTSADSLFQALSDSLAAIPKDPSTAFVKSIRYTDIRNGFNTVLAFEPGNRKAHLGSALLDLIEINYNSRLWAFIDSVDTYGDGTARSAIPGIHFRRGSPILGNQFALLATAPRELLRQTIQGIPDNLTVAEVQGILRDVVLPALNSALGHLDAADGGGGNMEPIYVNVEDETDEIDMGEVLFFHAATYAARAGLRMLTAYDFSLPGDDLTYGWIDNMRDLDGCSSPGMFEEIGTSGDWRAIHRYYFDRAPYQASEDSVIVAVAKWNLENRAAFLTQSYGGMSEAFDDLMATRDYVAAAVAAIRGETDADGQENDIIKLSQLTDIDSDIANGSDKPNFAASFQTIDDVLDWLDNEVMSGQLVVSEDNDHGCPMTFTVDLPGFFHSAPTDWKTMLPYHRFEAPGDWITDEISGPPYVQPHTGSYGLWDCGNTYLTHDNVTEVVMEYRKVSFDPLVFTNGSGGDIDLDVEKIPYLPHPDMGGLFPGATRDTWLQLVEDTCP